MDLAGGGGGGSKFQICIEFGKRKIDIDLAGGQFQICIMLIMIFKK